MKPVALICLSHGFHVRNILYSPFYRWLTESFEPAVVVAEGVAVPDTDRHLLCSARVHSIVFVPHRYEKLFVFLRKNVFAGRKRTQTFNLIGEAERNKHPWLYRIAMLLNSVLGRFPIFGSLWQKLEALFISGWEFDALLAQTRPAVLISANYGTEALEVRLLRAAHRRGVPSLALIPSWDNLSSKGVIGENPKHLSVWNEIMHEEAVSLYGFREKAIHVCGGLQFDMYASPPTAEQRRTVFDRLGIDEQRPYVVVGTITPRYFSKNIEIVDLITEAIKAGRLPTNLQIVVRLHPQVVDDPVYGDDLGQYRDRANRYSHVKLSIPRILDWGRIKPPAPDDMLELMVLLHGAVANVMPGSTLAIDSCALGAPVIGIGFDGREVKPYNESVRRMFDFTHYRRLVDQGGIRIAESAEQMIDEINLYHADRWRDEEGRNKIVSSHLGEVDGHTWERVASVVKQMAARSS